LRFLLIYLSIFILLLPCEINSRQSEHINCRITDSNNRQSSISEFQNNQVENLKFENSDLKPVSACENVESLVVSIPARKCSHLKYINLYHIPLIIIYKKRFSTFADHHLFFSNTFQLSHLFNILRI